MLAGKERGYIVRRLGAFAIDVVFAIIVAMAVPLVIAEVTSGRYRLTSVPGFLMFYCHPDDPPSISAALLADRARRSPPPRTTYWRTENCIALMNFVLRSPSVRVEFTPNDQSAQIVYYSVLTDFDGEATNIVPLNQYVPLLQAGLVFVFLIAAWFDSLGMRISGIRVRSQDGAKLGFQSFVIRFAIIGVVLAPIWFAPLDRKLVGFVATCVLAAILLAPWIRWRSERRRGLHDILARSEVVRVVKAD